MLKWVKLSIELKTMKISLFSLVIVVFLAGSAVAGLIE
jgi:hypothetical protein